MTIKDYKRYIEQNSQVDPDTKCWNWKKAKYKFGYGVATRMDTGNSGLAHRESYKAYIGLILDTDLVLHHCDNPSCVNPQHLFVGTQKDNMVDMLSKQRGPNRKGSNGTTVKLTEEQVEYIKSYSTHHGSGQELADQFNVSRTTICDIRKGRSWK